MFRRLRRLFVRGWKIVTRGWEVQPVPQRDYVICSNSIWINADTSRWRTDRFERFPLLWLVWRSILLVLNWRRRQIFQWHGVGPAFVGVDDYRGNEFVFTRPILPGQKFGLMKGYEGSWVFMVMKLYPGAMESDNPYLLDLDEVEDSMLPPDVLRI